MSGKGRTKDGMARTKGGQRAEKGKTMGEKRVMGKKKGHWVKMEGRREEKKGQRKGEGQRVKMEGRREEKKGLRKGEEGQWEGRKEVLLRNKGSKLNREGRRTNKG